jgi:hypothetical protein
MKWKSSDRDDKKSDIAEAMMRAVHSRARNTQHSRLNNAKAAFDVVDVFSRATWLPLCQSLSHDS